MANHTYSVHRAGFLEAPQGSPDSVRLDDEDWTTVKSLGKALRAAGVLPKGRSVRSACLVGDGVFIMPRSGPFWSIELKRTDLWTVIGRGKAGWRAERPGCSGSGGTLEAVSYPPRPYINDQPYYRDGYLAEAAEGCHVYDADATDYSAYVQHVLSGPMLSVGLADDECQRFGRAEQDAAARMLPGLGGGFEALAADGIASANSPTRTYSSLDRVGWGIFRGLLEALGGVRFGIVKTVNGVKTVVWES